jgi:hypothetical protein
MCAAGLHAKRPCTELAHEPAACRQQLQCPSSQSGGAAGHGVQRDQHEGWNEADDDDELVAMASNHFETSAPVSLSTSGCQRRLDGQAVGPLQADQPLAAQVGRCGLCRCLRELTAPPQVVSMAPQHITNTILSRHPQDDEDEVDRLLRAAYGSEAFDGDLLDGERIAAAAAAEAAEAADLAEALDSSAAELLYVPPALEAHRLDGQVLTRACATGIIPLAHGVAHNCNCLCGSILIWHSAAAMHRR